MLFCYTNRQSDNIAVADPLTHNPNPNHKQIGQCLSSMTCGPNHTWRASLQQVRTGETHHFARPEALWAFLQAEMASADERAAEPASLEATTRPDSLDDGGGRQSRR